MKPSTLEQRIERRVRHAMEMATNPEVLNRAVDRIRREEHHKEALKTAPRLVKRVQA